MIAPMDELTIVGRRSISRELLQSLQSLGVVQVDPLEPAEGQELVRVRLQGQDREERDRWNAVVARTESLLSTLGATEVTPAPRSEIPTTLDEIESYLATVGSQIDGIVAESGEIRDELDLIKAYLPLYRLVAPTLAQLEGSRYLAGTAFLVPADAFDATKAALEQAVEGRLLLSTQGYGKEVLTVAVTLKRDQEALRQALSRLGLSPLGLPGRYAKHGVAKAVHVMEERSQALPKRLALLQDELAKLAAQHAAKLAAINLLARNHQARYEKLEEMLQGRYSFALRGWVPSAEARRVVEGLKKQFGDDIVVATRPADEHHDHDVPVLLQNPAWVRPFQGLLALFAPPKYGSFDPSLTMAVFFPLFFGIVVGDVGFGLMFLAIGLWLRRRGKAGKSLSLGPLGIVIRPNALPAIGTVINWCAAWAMVWGVIYGEFFGNFLEKFPPGFPVFYAPAHSDTGLIPIALFRVEQFQPLLLLSIGFGVLQVLGGWLIRAYYGWRHHDAKHMWEGIGMFSGLVAIVLFAYSYMTAGLDASAIPGAVWVIVTLGFAIFLLAAIIARMPLMIVEIISNSGHILSYLRLFAVGLSAALVANLATDLGFALAGVAPVIGPLLGIIVALSVHLIAIALTIIGHTLQPLRLQYVEFFTKFGYHDESGRPYQPFRLHGGKA